jgi:hypothetical protein
MQSQNVRSILAGHAEPLPPSQQGRLARLRTLLSGPWANRPNAVVFRWRPDQNVQDGGFWIMWVDPDPFDEAGVTPDCGSIS